MYNPNRIFKVVNNDGWYIKKGFDNLTAEEKESAVFATLADLNNDLGCGGEAYAEEVLVEEGTAKYVPNEYDDYGELVSGTGYYVLTI